MRKGFFLALALEMTGALSAQPLRSPTTFPWCNNPVANGLNNLTDAQTKQINATCSEYRDALKDLYAQVNAAEGNLEVIFNQDSIDQRKADQAVNQLANARGDLTRTLSQMSLKLRNVLTADQWRDLQARQAGRGAARPGARRRGPGPGPGPVGKGSAPSSAPPAAGSPKAAPSNSITQK
jgi:Spy/CpxP family protein refolding chaperone